MRHSMSRPVRQPLDSDTRWLVHFAIIAAAAGLIAIVFIAIFLPFLSRLAQNVL